MNISALDSARIGLNLKRTPVNNQPSKVMSTPAFEKYTATNLMNAYQAFHSIPTAKSISFGKSLSNAFKDLMYPSSLATTAIFDFADGSKE